MSGQNLGQIVKGTFEKFRDYAIKQTFDYIPQSAKCSSHRTQAIITGALASVAYWVDYDLVCGGVLAYSAIKAYQAIRDWAGK